MTSSLKVVLCLLSTLPLLHAHWSRGETPHKGPWKPHTFSTGSPFPPNPGFPAGFPLPAGFPFPSGFPYPNAYPFPSGFPYDPAQLWVLLAQYNAALNNAATATNAAALAAAAAASGAYAAQFPYKDPSQRPTIAL